MQFCNVCCCSGHKIIGVIDLLNYILFRYNIKIFIIAAIADCEGLSDYIGKSLFKYSAFDVALMEFGYNAGVLFASNISNAKTARIL